MITKDKLKKNAVCVIDTVDEQKLSNLWSKVKFPQIEKIPSFKPYRQDTLPKAAQSAYHLHTPPAMLIQRPLPASASH
jgi:hypothetical protein